MMWLFLLLSVPVVVLSILYGLFFMSAKGTSWIVRINVGLAWFAALSTLVLVPTDVANALQGQDPELLRVWWKVAYWYGFVAMFTVLPLLQEYYDSGHFHFADRVATAIRNNLMFYLLLGGLGAAALLLLVLTHELKPSNMIGFCIALSNAFGLIAGIFLMGYGLVAVPRQLWRMADVRGRQRLLHHKAGTQAEKAIAAHGEASTAIELVTRVSQMFGRRDPMRLYMEKIMRMADDVRADIAPAPVDLDDDVDLDYFDRIDLGRLRRRVRKGIENYQREREIYLEIVDEYFEVEDVLNNMEHGLRPFVSTRHAPLPAWLATLEWVWKCCLHAWLFRFLAALTGLLSLAVVVAEATISDQLPNMSLFSRVLHSTAESQTVTQVLTFVFLAYPCLCAYYAIYKLGRFSFYLLVPHHTDSYSLLSHALLMCRFSAPLAFNFMAALAMPESSVDAPAKDVTDTVFYSEFGAIMMKQPVIGTQFATYAPLAIIPYMFLLLLNIFNRVAGCIRSKSLQFEDDWELNSGVAADGMRLLKTELENRRNGLPRGRTIQAALSGGGGRADVESLLPPQVEKGGRWRWFGAASNKPSSGGLPSDGKARSGGPASTVLDARARLSQALGRGLPNSRYLSNALEEESVDLLSNGPSRSSQGSQPRESRDLDSIFARLESSQDGGPSESRKFGRSVQAINVESDSDDGGAGKKWFWNR